MTQAAVVETDPWLDDEFAQPYTDPHGSTLLDDLAEIERNEPQQFPASLNPERVTNIPEPVVLEPEQVVEPLEPEEPTGPEVIELDGGGTLTIEKKGKKWCAALDTGSGGTQNFYGLNKNELLVASFKAQANATRKIRELNRQVKLGPVTEQPTPTAPKTAAGRELTADEIVELKLLMSTNPAAAFESWLQKRTNLTADQLSKLSQRADAGYEAKQELTAEQVNKSFLQRNPEFFPDKDYENFNSLVSYLGRNKLGRTVTAKNTDEIYQSLLEGGNWSVQNLEEAYNSLNEDGLLITRPKAAPVHQPTPAAVVAPTPVAAQPRTDDRIVRTETRPRASLGIRSSETAPAAPTSHSASTSVEDPDNMSPDQLLAAIRRERQALRNSPGRR